MQRESSISFPMFGSGSINPPSYFNLFGRNIYFYGVIVAFAFILGTLYCTKKAKLVGIRADDVYDVLLWLIPLCIVGARIYYVLFRLDYYLAHPSEIFAIWEGGLAIYGGIIVGALVIFFICRRKKIPVMAVLDLFIIACIIGQAIGRWGNFMNREAFGSETDIFCRMGLTSPSGTTIYVHPTFLYESLWNLAGFIFLNWFLSSGKRKYDGQCFLIYLLWYGLGRSWIEGLRTDSLYIGHTNLRISQLLSIAMIIVSAVLLIINAKKQHKPEDLFVNRVNAGAPGVEVIPENPENPEVAEPEEKNETTETETDSKE